MPRDYNVFAFQGAVDQLRKSVLGLDNAVLAHLSKLARQWLFCKPLSLSPWRTGTLYDAKNLGGEARRDRDKLRRDHRPENTQRPGGGRLRLWDIIRSLELKSGILGHLRLSVSGMYAGEPEAPARAVEGEQTPIGDERNRTAGTIYIVCARPRRADEIYLLHQGAAGVLEPEQDHLGNDVVQVGGPERAGKADLRLLKVILFRLEH